MKKLFISQPMRGKTDQQIKEERNNIIQTCKLFYGEDVEVIDSFIEGAPHDANPLWYLGQSLQFLSKADLNVNKVLNCKIRDIKALNLQKTGQKWCISSGKWN